MEIEEKLEKDALKHFFIIILMTTIRFMALFLVLIVGFGISVHSWWAIIVGFLLMNLAAAKSRSSLDILKAVAKKVQGK